MHPMLRIGIDAIQASKLSRGCPRLPFGKDPCEVDSRHVLWVDEIPLRVEGRVMRRTSFQDRVRPGTDLSKTAVRLKS
jgi:hypothetical protein